MPNCLIGETPLDTVHNVAVMINGYTEAMSQLAKLQNSPVLEALSKSMQNSHTALKRAEQALEEQCERGGLESSDSQSDE